MVPNIGAANPKDYILSNIGCVVANPLEVAGGELGHGHVGGVGDGVGERFAAPVAPRVVIELAAAQAVLAAVVADLLLGRHAVREERRRGHELEDRSGGKELGLGEPGLTQLAQAGFRALGLQTFLTAGPKETRAWEIRAGATAPEAAGVIHSDFQRGFIKAEVVSYDDLIAAGSLAAARAAGKARIEGKDYIMRDGDVVEFRFNV